MPKVNEIIKENAKIFFLKFRFLLLKNTQSPAHSTYYEKAE